MDDELLDLVDKNDTVIGTINRKDYSRLMAEKRGYFRAADLFLLNSKGQVYTPIRTAHKTIAPNGYDYSAGGHVAAGDSYLSTIIREAREELNIDVNEKDVILVAKTTLEDIRYIQSIFLLYRDETPIFNKDDFVSAEWLSPHEVIRKIDEGHPAKSRLKETLLLLQEYLADA